MMYIIIPRTSHWKFHDLTSFTQSQKSILNILPYWL